MSKYSTYPAVPAGDTGSPLLSIGFFVLLTGMFACFLYWGTGYTNQNHLLLFILASLFGVFMAFNIGGNDVANSFGTSVGAGTLTIKQALLVAAVFEVSGAVIAGGQVTSTIRGGIVDLSGIDVDPLQFVFIMMSALVAAALWLLFATHRGYPVSTTHSIVGAIVGSSITLGVILDGAGNAFTLVQWDKVLQIVMSWVLSPVLGGLVSYLIFLFIKKKVLAFNNNAHAGLELLKAERRAARDRQRAHVALLGGEDKAAYQLDLEQDEERYENGGRDASAMITDYYGELCALDERRRAIGSHRALENIVPLLAAGGSLVITSMVLTKGLKNLNLDLGLVSELLLLCMFGAAVWLGTFFLARTLRKTSLEKSTFILFSWMQVFTAAGFAFSHGANDIANSIGPFAAILDVLRTGQVDASAPVPTIAMVTFGIALVAGLWFIGKEVILTVGHNLTRIHPSSGFSAELGAAAVVMLASVMGLPVSSTHILIGAVMGIGLVNSHANWGLMRPIALAWIITLPVAGLLSAGAFLLLNGVFG